ncbi:MAG: phosphotransferase [Alphaproteobacteria bacterium]|nr:phosphotransferase [Alphaproteobacteria bacterium]
MSSAFFKVKKFLSPDEQRELSGLVQDRLGLSGYQILGYLGQGRYGVTYLAQSSSGEMVVIKISRETTNPYVREIFDTEVKSLQTIKQQKIRFANGVQVPWLIESKSFAEGDMPVFGSDKIIGYQIMTWIPGSETSHEIINDALIEGDKEGFVARYASSLAALLGDMHFKLDKMIGKDDVKPLESDRAYEYALLAKAHAETSAHRVTALAATNSLIEDIKKSFAESVAQNGTVVIHGDMHAGNVLLHRDGEVNSVFDFSHVRRTAPELELVTLSPSPLFMVQTAEKYTVETGRVLNKKLLYSTAAAMCVRYYLFFQERAAEGEAGAAEKQELYRYAAVAHLEALAAVTGKSEYTEYAKILRGEESSDPVARRFVDRDTPSSFPCPF